MKLSFAKCESIVNTLPIGFYTGRRIEVALDKDVNTSFYDPMEDRIIISYPIIAERLESMPETSSCDEEEAVRSMLYHEVSHAILTPANAINNSFHLNCFEDERIESVLRHYFHGVDFRKQLYDIHGGNPPKAVDAKSAYFNAVRFGLGTGVVQKRVNNILRTYSPLHRESKRWGNRPNAGDYEYAVEDLWDLIRQEFKDHPEEFQPKMASGKEGKDMDKLSSKSVTGVGNGQNEGEGQLANLDGEDPYFGDPHECEMTKEQIQKLVGASLSNHPNLDEAQIAKLNDFQRTVEMIIGNFNKKNKGGSGINTYSGAFNPRAVARKDYRFFERAMTTQGNNKFGTCHLNLIIDCSGSFYDNVPITNGILSVLSEIERKNRNFSMDVAFINDEFRLCKTVRERKMIADGGNAIPDDMKDILIRLQKPQTCNYNIVLFDGNAICQNYYGKDCNKLFSVFDMKQTTLITDPDNEQYMNPPFTSTKVVVTRKYTEELIDHIIHALMIAFG